MKRIFFKGRFIFIPIAVAAVATLAGFVVMQLWNNLMPAIFHLGLITFWQALGLFILCKILFGFGKGGRGWGHRDGAPWMRHRMEERFKNMTPEEREKFKQKWGEHCGFGRRGRQFDKEWESYTNPESKPAE